MTKWKEQYQLVKKSVYRVIEEPSNERRWYHYGMILLVMISIWQLVMQVELANDLILANRFHLLGDLLNGLFLIEYLLRWWINTSLTNDYRTAVEKYHRSSYNPKRSAEILHGLSFAILNKLRWMVKPLSLVDLLAILPMFRALRLLRVLHFLKLFRYSKRISFFSNIIGERRYEMVSLLYAGLIVWGMVAVAFFIAEHGINSKVETLSSAMYWSIITITTVGYGDITPVTEFGRVIAAFGVLVGMSVTVMFTSLIVSVFTDRIFNLQEYHMEQKIAKLQDHFIVCGLNALGQFTCQSLITENRSFIAIDSDKARVDSALEKGWIAICGDVTEYKTWEQARISRASGVVSSILNEAINVYIIMMVREINPKCFVVACGNQLNSEKRLLRIGADRVVSPFQNAGQHLAQTAIRPNALHFLNLALNQGYADLVVEEVAIAPGSIFDFTLLRDSKLRENYNAFAIGVLSQGIKMTTTPPPEYRLVAGDVLICLGHKLDLQRLKHAASQMSIDNVLDKLELAQILVTPGSSIVNTPLKDAEFRSRFRVQLVGMVHAKQIMFKLDMEMHFSLGDVLICLGFRDQLEVMRKALSGTSSAPLDSFDLNLDLERIRIPEYSFLQGKTLRNSMLRSNFFCTVVAVQPVGEDLILNPLPDYRFTGDETILCLGRRADLDRMKGVVG
ncbi:MAG: NAD-binding protein [Magnetococcales bacterium]|nr:NAD-binding protein [Magnetococcales bacterium]